MKKKSDNPMKDLHRLLSRQKFTSDADMQAFMTSLMNKPIPSFDPKDLTPQELAQDLVSESAEQPFDLARFTLGKALTLDPECIDAYGMLAAMEEEPLIAMVFYEHAVRIGEKKFGGSFERENKGYFWGLTETRPYMRLLFEYAQCLYDADRKDQCLTIMKRLLELNPNDNQGVRDTYRLYLLELGQMKEFERVDALYRDDTMAFSMFNRAMHAFIVEGDTERSQQLLNDAVKSNKHIIRKILSNKLLPLMPELYSPGDTAEAVYYSIYARPVWKKISGGLDWLQRHHGVDRKKILKFPSAHDGNEPTTH